MSQQPPYSQTDPLWDVYVLVFQNQDGEWLASMDWPAYQTRRAAENRAETLTLRSGTKYLVQRFVNQACKP